MKPTFFKLTFCLLLIVFACKKEKTQLIEFAEINLTTPDNSIVEINIPKAKGNSEAASKINNTIVNYVIYALQFDKKTASSIKESIQDFNAEFKDFKTQFPDSAQQWEAEVDGEISYQTPELICVALTAYTNTGGAHGNSVISFLNFDAESGKIISNSELFSNKEAFKKITKTYFEKENSENLLDKTKPFSLPENIGFNDEGVILLYNTYEVAPYVVGIIEFTIPFNEVREYLNY